MRSIKPAAEHRDVLRVALRADVHADTVTRYLNGASPMRPASRRRIEAALRDLGLVHLLRDCEARP
jgi:DNA-binding LacI/PurR family transcriptional regulator